jgi:hypothetical protein
MTEFVAHPLNAADAPQRATLIGNISKADVAELELETINTESDIVLLSCSKEENFWKPVGPTECPLLRGTALSFNSCFGFTCLLETSFSCMNKSKKNTDRDSQAII